ncbi:MAG: bifunctional riboflavin kinase/FAD synthetase [Actinomycetes bacterium]
MMTSSVVAVGVFDGVHGGHKVLIDRARRIADQRSLPLVVASFNPHPAMVLRPGTFLGLLTLPERRAELLRDAGADRVEFLTFDDTLRNMSADEFVENIIQGRLHAAAVVVGRNFRFGRKASGDVDALQVLANKYGFDVDVVDLAGDTQSWSSTRIRQAILAGDVAMARDLLARPHRLSGPVVHGDHRGRELGFPTANIAVPEELLIPMDGVYSAIVRVAGQSYPAAVSIGTNPTFEGVLSRRVEAHVIGHTDLDLYGQMADLDFIDFVRPMLKFEGIDPLIAAMNNDVVLASAQISDFLDS